MMSKTTGKTVEIGSLRRGRRFESDFGSGVVVMRNKCRVRVRLAGVRTREFETADGKTVRIKSTRETDWSPTTEVRI